MSAEITLSLNSANRSSLADSPFDCTVPFASGAVRDVKYMRLSSINIDDDGDPLTNYVFIQLVGPGQTKNIAEYAGNIANNVVLKFQLPGNKVPGQWVANGMIEVANSHAHGATVRDIRLRVLNPDLTPYYGTEAPGVDWSTSTANWSFDLTLITEPTRPSA